MKIWKQTTFLSLSLLLLLTFSGLHPSHVRVFEQQGDELLECGVQTVPTSEKPVAFYVVIDESLSMDKNDPSQAQITPRRYELAQMIANYLLARSLTSGAESYLAVYHYPRINNTAYQLPIGNKSVFDEPLVFITPEIVNNLLSKISVGSVPDRKEDLEGFLAYLKTQVQDGKAPIPEDAQPIIFLITDGSALEDASDGLAVLNDTLGRVSEQWKDVHVPLFTVLLDYPSSSSNAISHEQIENAWKTYFYGSFSENVIGEVFSIRTSSDDARSDLLKTLYSIETRFLSRGSWDLNFLEREYLYEMVLDGDEQLAQLDFLLLQTEEDYLKHALSITRPDTLKPEIALGPLKDLENNWLIEPNGIIASPESGTWVIERNSPGADRALLIFSHQTEFLIDLDIHPGLLLTGQVAEIYPHLIPAADEDEVEWTGTITPGIVPANSIDLNFEHKTTSGELYATINDPAYPLPDADEYTLFLRASLFGKGEVSYSCRISPAKVPDLQATLLTLGNSKGWELNITIAKIDLIVSPYSLKVFLVGQDGQRSLLRDFSDDSLTERQWEEPIQITADQGNGKSVLVTLGAGTINDGVMINDEWESDILRSLLPTLSPLPTEISPTPPPVPQVCGPSNINGWPTQAQERKGFVLLILGIALIGVILTLIFHYYTFGNFDFGRLLLVFSGGGIVILLALHITSVIGVQMLEAYLGIIQIIFIIIGSLIMLVLVDCKSCFDG